MEKIDKKLLVNIIVGICLVSAITTCINLFISFFQILQRRVTDYGWPTATLILIGLLSAASLIFFVLRLMNQHKTIHLVGIILSAATIFMNFIFILTLISTDSFYTTVQTLLISIEIPLVLIFSLVDASEFKKYITITTSNENTENKVEEIENSKN